MTARSTPRGSAPATARPRAPIGAIVAVAAMVGVILLVALNLLPISSAGSIGSGAPTSPGQLAPDLQVRSIDGRTFQLGANRGKVVALYFAAAWCPSCQYEAQAWTQLYQRYRDRGLEVVMLDVDSTEGASQWEGFRQLTGGGSQIWALDPGLQIASAFGVTSLETSIVIDRQGKIAYRHGATVSLQQLQQEVEKLL